ncbi:MAG TPA: Pvc16 family protein [Microlunatus sp.]|nr:Pvc16 family protein [Microlunatus sp.]
MIHEVDSALRTLIEREAAGMRDVEIVFDAPTREWAGRRNSPTIDVYLYDIREDLRRRERGMHNVYDESNLVVSRRLPPRHFKLSYLVTAWTQRPEDEHRLLSSLLVCFLKYDALPADVLTGPLTELGLPIPITIALPPPEDRAFADVWSALGRELKPSIDIVVSTPLDTGQSFHTGPPVEVPPRVSLGGSYGWPTRETKSRNGVEKWPAGTTGPTPGDGSENESENEGADTPATTGGKRTSRTRAGGRGKAASGAAGEGATSASSSAEGTGPPRSSGWDLATGWANAMAPPGSAESSELLPGRAAGRPTAGATGRAQASGTTERAGADGAGESAGPITKAASATKSGGRPGPRVAITRTRQTKKKP